MRLSEGVIAAAIGNVIGAGSHQLVRQISTGRVRVHGKRNDVYINVSPGFPPGGAACTEVLARIHGLQRVRFRLMDEAARYMAPPHLFRLSYHDG